VKLSPMATKRRQRMGYLPNRMTRPDDPTPESANRPIGASTRPAADVSRPSPGNSQLAWLPWSAVGHVDG
jgi:hypothetical protein